LYLANLLSEIFSFIGSFEGSFLTLPLLINKGRPLAALPLLESISKGKDPFLIDRDRFNSFMERVEGRVWVRVGVTVWIRNTIS
jgi:hypothetical protein